MVSPGFETRDTQDHGEGEEWFCTGDGTQDSGFGAAFRVPLASECEAGSAEHRQENSDNGREDAHSAIKLCDGVHQLLSVLVERFDGDDRALTTSSPGMAVGVSSIAKATPAMAHLANQNLNDIKHAALAYTFVRKVCAQSCAAANLGQSPGESR